MEFEMPTASQDKIRIHVNVEITAAALQTIVSHAKHLARRNENGILCIDTADQVSEMISRFLEEKDFESFLKSVTKE
jgi:hypothetical protein